MRASTLADRYALTPACGPAVVDSDSDGLPFDAAMDVAMNDFDRDQSIETDLAAIDLAAPIDLAADFALPDWTPTFGAWNWQSCDQPASAR